MLKRGKTIPESKIAGIRTSPVARYIACIWLLDTFEINTPIPSDPTINTRLNSNNSIRLPVMTMSK